MIEIESIGHVALATLLTVITLLFLAWLVKKFKKINYFKHEDINLLATLNIGHKEKIAIIEVLDRRLLVGITQYSIQPLTELNASSKEGEAPLLNSEVIKT